MPPFDPSQFDPSKMDPKVLMELSKLIRELPPEKLSKMQTLMHNMMAGFDVKKDMEEFERTLPPGFREKLMNSMGGQAPFYSAPPATVETEGHTVSESESPEMNLHEARITLLRAVANGEMSPEDAEKLLFPQ